MFIANYPPALRHIPAMESSTGHHPPCLSVCLSCAKKMQSSTAALPFYPVMVIVAMFVFIVFPMTVIGAIIGRNTASDFQAPCRTTRVPRQVWPVHFYHLLSGVIVSCYRCCEESIGFLQCQSRARLQ